MASWDHEDLKDPRDKKQANTVWTEEAPAYEARKRREDAARNALIDELLAKEKAKMTDNDFGFTTVDEKDLISSSDKYKTILEIQQMINPFLTKLQADPNKAMLKWPNRAKEVEDFQQKFNAYCDKAKSS
jgi:hypothetical protein